MDSRFPDGFMWGAATSSHQVEGNNHNDWTMWEKAGHTKDGVRSAEAADHWHLWQNDFDLLEELDLNAYRFSVEWSRIEPRPGDFDTDAIAHYRQQLQDLKKRGITPIVTLHHYTNPLWTAGWIKGKMVKQFDRYVRFVVSELGEHARYWCTINEPNVYTSLGWLQGQWPPGSKNPIKAYRVQGNLIAAHKSAYKAIHQIYQQQDWGRPAVSMALNLQYFEPRPNPLDKLVTAIVRYFTNSYTLNRTANHLDYIGANYYFANRLSLIPPRFQGGLDTIDGQELPHTDLGWVIYPRGLYFVLRKLKKYNLQIIITENGLADAEDTHRERFIRDHLRSVKEAIDDGVDVRGYMHWSLIDNFEWLEGFDGRFGLVAVDFDTQERRIRPSAKVYARIASTNQLEEELS